MSYTNTLSTEAAFQRYEAVRHRFPSAAFPDTSITCSGLIDIADQFDAVLLDSFGVLNVGDHPIPGAPECIATLRAMGKQLVVLTNAASYPKAEAVQKYDHLGFDFTAAEVVSSRDVAAARLESIAPGVTWSAIAAPEDRFEDIAAPVRHWDGAAAEAVLLLSSVTMSPDLIAELAAMLRVHPVPVVVANPDLVAPRETGLSKEPGFFAHALADQIGLAPTFFGKPFPAAFKDALRRVQGVPTNRVVMVGDTLHTDILGGRAVGARTALVRNHGLFAGEDVDGYIARSGITPDFQCGGI